MSQKIINNDVKEAVDTTHYAIQGLIDIWNILPLGIQVLIILVVVTSLAMQTIKKTILFDTKPKNKKLKLMWRWGMLAGVLITGAGYWLTKGAQLQDVYWAAIGISVSNIAMGVHWISMKVIWPKLMKLKKIKISFGDDDA